SLCDDILMLALESRIRHLEGVEDAHVDLLAHVRQRAGDANKAHFALGLELQRLLQGAIDLEFVAGEAAMELDESEVVGLHQAQAVLDALANVLGCVDVVAALGRVRNTATLRGEEVLIAAVGYVLADELFAPAIVDRGVDEVDAGVEDSVQHLLG